MKRRIMIIDPKDNVGIALERLEAGQLVTLMTAQGSQDEITVRDTIPIYHKIAISRIEDNQTVLKYGESIGKALGVIEKGSHVHLHNLKDSRGITMLEGREA